MCNISRCIPNLKKVCSNGDPISAYLFILCLEILFTIVKNNEDTKNLKILGKSFFYTAYVDDKTFFLIKARLNKRIKCNDLTKYAV